MVLEKLKFKNDPLCLCSECNGKGITNYRFSNIGVICSKCDGTGYEQVQIDDSYEFYIDLETEIIYKMVMGYIVGRTPIFKGFDKSYLVEYVTYDDVLQYYKKKSKGKNINYKDAFCKAYFIAYSNFIRGYLPRSLTNDAKKRDIEQITNDYELTGKKTVLNSFQLGEKIKCKCSTCMGKGIVEHFSYSNDIGVICPNCNGIGYHYEHINEIYYYATDMSTGIVYSICGKEIRGRNNIFSNLSRKDGINYVLYDNFGILHRFINGERITAKKLFEIGISKDELISYLKFLNGRLPLPIEKYNCPNYLTNRCFDNNCSINRGDDDYIFCSKYGTSECWDKFYGETKTAGEKQNVLRKI